VPRDDRIAELNSETEALRDRLTAIEAKLGLSDDDSEATPE